MTALAALKADQARIWGSASWQQIAERQLFPVHELFRGSPHARGIKAARPYLLILGRRIGA